MRRFKTLSYFFRTINFQLVSESKKQGVLTLPFLICNYRQQRFCSNEVVPSTTQENSAMLDPAKKVDLSNYGSVLLPSYNLASYADESPLLQEFIKLGVELYKFDKNPKIGEFLLKLDFEKNVKPYLVFLHDNGVPAEEFGQFITKCPMIFQEDLNDLQVRINYLQSKKFSRKMIVQIITKNPKWLTVPVTKIDERLGYLQLTFKLKGDHVRKIITQAPGLATVPKKVIMLNTFTLKEEMNLDEHSLKKLILSVPVLLKKDSYETITTYDYLTRTMNVQQHLILKQPTVLTVRKFILNERHKFLVALGRAQYNPLLPGYVSLLNLITTTDNEFCEKVAKASIHTYNEFLKTL